MPLFDTNDEIAVPVSRKKAPAPEPTAVAPETKTAPPTSEAPAEIRRMSGFNSISDVAAAAKRSESSDISTSAAPKTSRKKQAQIEAEAKVKADAEAKERRKAVAMQRVGRHLMARLAKAPYEVWARLVADPELKLTTDERTELVEDYMLLVEGFDVDFSKPIWIILGILGSHSILITERVSYIEKRKKGLSVRLSESQRVDRLKEEAEESEEAGEVANFISQNQNSAKQ